MVKMLPYGMVRYRTLYDTCTGYQGNRLLVRYVTYAIWYPAVGCQHDTDVIGQLFYYTLINKQSCLAINKWSQRKPYHKKIEMKP
jgi:hypothetical protein